MMVVDGRLMMGKQGFGGAVDLFKVDSNGLEFQTLHSIALHCIDHFEYIALQSKFHFCSVIRGKKYFYHAMS